MHKSLVSVIIPTYNRKKRLIRAVKSVINQTYRPLEVIIVNDGNVEIEPLIENSINSNDLNDISFTILDNELNFGACLSRNRGILKASGKYITLCDDDDIFEPDRIKNLVSLLEKEKVNIVFSDSINRFKTHDLQTKLPNHVTHKNLKKGNVIGAQVLTFTKFSKAVQFDPKFIASQDHDYNYRLLKAYGTALKHDKASYISSQYECENRVSNNKIMGSLQFYLKHKRDFCFLDKVVFHLKFIKNYATS